MEVNDWWIKLNIDYVEKVIKQVKKKEALRKSSKKVLANLSEKQREIILNSINETYSNG